MKKILINIFFFFCFWGISFSQDIHFSQFASSPLNLDPSLTGNFNGNYRFCGNFKNQWQSITVPYRTFSASAEKRMPFRRNYFGAGLLFNSDKAGDSDFGTTQAKLSFALGRNFSPDSLFSASLGFNVAYNQYSINYNNLYFGNQFSGGQFNSSIPSNENFSRNNYNYIDYSAGLGFCILIKKRIPLNFGIALIHINKPSQSFINQQLNNLDQKYTFHFSSDFKLKENLYFLPLVVFYNQGQYREIDYGGMFRIGMDNINFHNFYLGSWYRQGDALIAMIGFDYQSINLALSYDFNSSKLRSASNGFGGTELSVIYLLYKRHSLIVPLRKQCPSFL